MPSDSTTTTLTATATLPFHTGTVFWNGGSLGTITLPSDVTYYGARYDIKNLSGHTVVLDPAGSATIEGVANISLVTADWSYTVAYDGSTYRVL